MNPFYEDYAVRQYCGHALDVLAQLPEESVQCCVTSPPYWTLRKYAGEQEFVWGDNHCEHEWDIETITAETWNRDGHTPDFREAQLTRAERPNRWQKVEHKRGFCRLCDAWRGAYGTESTPEMYVEHTIEILRAIRRVLRPAGVVFWNIGDSYANDTKWGGKSSGKNYTSAAGGYPRQRRNTGLKSKNLCLIPFRVAIAAQEDGWWVRSVIIWSKNNPLPESVKDRPTRSHEYILMLTKSARYYWDAEAVREPQTGNAHNRGTGKSDAVYQEARDSYRGFKSTEAVLPAGRNMRSVWQMNTQAYPGIHFATFPEKLAERCILAATSEKANCSKCGKPWVRIVKKGFTAHDGKTESQYSKGTTANRLALMRQAAREQGHEYVNETKTLGWKPTCSCNAPAEPAVVLDPFSGSGRTLYVAKKLGRHAIGIDCSKDYCAMAVEQIRRIML